MSRERREYLLALLREYPSHPVVQKLYRALVYRDPLQFSNPLHYRYTVYNLHGNITWLVTESYVVACCTINGHQRYERVLIFGLNEDGGLFVTEVEPWRQPCMGTDGEIHTILGYEADVNGDVYVIDKVVAPSRLRVQGDLAVWFEELEGALRPVVESAVYELVNTCVGVALMDFLASKGVTADSLSSHPRGVEVYVPVRETVNAYEGLCHLCKMFKEEVRGILPVDATVTHRPDRWGFDVLLQIKGDCNWVKELRDEVMGKFLGVEPTSYVLRFGRHRVECYNVYPRNVTITFKHDKLDLLTGLPNQEYAVTIRTPPNTIRTTANSEIVFKHPEHRMKTLKAKRCIELHVFSITPRLFTEKLNVHALTIAKNT